MNQIKIKYHIKAPEWKKKHKMKSCYALLTMDINYKILILLLIWPVVVCAISVWERSSATIIAVYSSSNNNNSNNRECDVPDTLPLRIELMLPTLCSSLFVCWLFFLFSVIVSLFARRRNTKSMHTFSTVNGLLRSVLLCPCVRKVNRIGIQVFFFLNC